MDYLEMVLDDPDGGPYEWVQILACFWDLARSDERAKSNNELPRPLTETEEEIILKGARFEGNVNLAHCFDGPHSRPPDVMIRRACRHILASRGILIPESDKTSLED